MSRRLDRDVRARSDCEPEIRLREGGRVVDPVADHRDDLAGLLQPTHLGDLVVGIHLGEDSLDPDLGRDALCGLSGVAGQQDRREVELLESGDRLRARRLDRVENGERRPRHAVPRDRDDAVSAPDLDRVTLDGPDDADAGDVSELVYGRKLTDLATGGVGHGSGDRMLRRGFDGPREAEHVLTARAVERRDVGESHAPLGHGAGLVEHDRRRSGACARAPRAP